MARPTSKQALLDAIDKELAALRAEIAPLTADEMVTPDVVGPWSAKDVFAHLVAWQQMCLGWYEAGLAGETPELPAPGYKWNQTPALNEMIYHQYRDMALDEVMASFEQSHAAVLDVISNLSNDELFGASPYPWTGKNTVGTYFVSVTSSHYLWARKEIRRGLKAMSAA
jgi:hypothetical protein